MNTGSQTSISVVIPTFRRADDLARALESLRWQTCPDFEVLVVDNDADPEVEALVRNAARGMAVDVRYVPEPALGLHNARHAAVRAARGELLLFTDDDATFDPDWVGAYARAFAAHPGMQVAGGPVRPVWEVAPPEWILRYMGDGRTFYILSLFEPFDGFRLEQGLVFIGVNMAVRKSAVVALGGFNPDSFGPVWLGDGETGLNRKFWAAAIPVGYVHDAVVMHHIPPGRLTRKYFTRRMANEGACDMYKELHPAVPGPVRLVRRALSLAVRNAPSWVRALALRRRSDPAALDAVLHAHRTFSRFNYVLRVLLDREFRALVERRDWLGPLDVTGSGES